MSVWLSTGIKNYEDANVSLNYLNNFLRDISSEYFNLILILNFFYVKGVWLTKICVNPCIRWKSINKYDNKKDIHSQSLLGFKYFLSRFPEPTITEGH